MAFKPIGTPRAFIVHHTAGRGGVQGVLDTLKQRGLGVQYVMDRDGKIYETGGAGVSQMLPGSGAGAGLSNANTVGMEVIARDDNDVTPQQVAAATEFIKATYPGIAVYGHGQVNPGHKQASEGMRIVNAYKGIGSEPTVATAEATPPLADTLAAAAGPSAEEVGKAQLYSNLAGGLSNGVVDNARAKPVDVTGDPTGAPQAMTLPTASAAVAPTELPALQLAPAAPTLADLFTVKDIGGAALPKQPVQPVRRA